MIAPMDETRSSASSYVAIITQIRRR